MSFKDNIINIYGDKGKEWLVNLPNIVEQFALKFGLTNLRPVDNLSFNYVLSGLQGKKPIILKLGLATELLNKEADALKAFGGYGAVKLLAQEDGLLLLERANPGTSLKTYLDQGKKHEALNIICNVVQRLHTAPIPKNHTFPCVSDIINIIDEGWDIDEKYLSKGRKLKDRRLLANALLVLLHGDLHHNNVMQNKDEWLVIDPHGVIGHPINELWAFVIDINYDTKYIAKFFGYDVGYVREWYFMHLLIKICEGLKYNTKSTLFIELIEKAYKLI